MERDEGEKAGNATVWAAKMVWEAKESMNGKVTVEETKEARNYDAKPLPAKPTFFAMMKRKISGGNWDGLGKLKMRGSQ